MAKPPRQTIKRPLGNFDNELHSCVTRNSMASEMQFLLPNPFYTNG